MNLTVDESEKTGILCLSGSLTIERIAEIKQTVEDAWKHVNRLIIDHSEAKEFDLTYFQILFSCYKTSIKVQKKFSINRTDKLQDILKSLGLPDPDFYSGQENGGENG